ncbi:M48 family metallopeptidase [Pseudoduganella violacea]|uniref:Zn-dependent protease with chaperone function/type II secretory pathway pseudopilin PulG n=1 Tax=Pseudoduganella violacea TaxID=1715466 RepID=A0A7W5FVJ5_9BURK|nr:M48 family metallopeptidase [Pseudoduganella violacea]MBB3120293.1 Zn-dependent protease with chaperone function/type II secretory pathway pseudopilin PulG [Pseudoduganella violacea]
MELVYRNEKKLFRLMLGISVLFWTILVVVLKTAILAYFIVFLLIYCFMQSAVVSHLKGTAVRISYSQFPDLKARVDVCCERLGVQQVPEAYLLQMGGIFNGFATRFLGNNIIVLYSEVVDALEDKPDAINFYIGHEIGHIKRQHMRWAALLLPASVLPLLGAAYARAREYSCDRHGFHACDDLKSAQIGLAALAAGARRWRNLSIGTYSAQAQQSAGFWMSFHELISDHPWLVKRMAVMRALAGDGTAQLPGRHALAYLPALLLPRLALAGGASGVLAVLAVVAVFGAIGIPVYKDFGDRQRMAHAVNVGKDATAAVERYFYVNGRNPDSLAEAGYALDDPNHAVVDVKVDGASGTVQVFPADFSYRGKAIAFMPALDENRKLVWRCGSDGIPAKLLPADCRGRENN